MTDAVDHGKAVLGTIFRHRAVKTLDYARRNLTAAHFTDSVQAELFGMAERYADQTQGVLTRGHLSAGLRGKAPGTALKYEEYFDLCCEAALADSASFRFAVAQLRELYAERATGEMITTSMDILTRGVTADKADGQAELRGHQDSRAFLRTRLSEIDMELAEGQSPEGDMRLERQQILDDLARRAEQQRDGTGVLTGIGPLDAMLGGGTQRGELDLVAGFTSSGKTAWCCQAAWHAVTQQGKNVVIFTSETLRAQVRFKILARHSAEEKFGITDRDGRRGINTRDFKRGLQGPQQSAFFRVLDDFSGNPGYGHCYIAQVPRGATVGVLESSLARLARNWTADLVIIDYLALLRPEIRHRDLRESLVEIIKEAKAVATTYRDGLGVPVLSPWQVRREARDEASKRGHYTLNDLSETAEASNTADVVVSLLEPDSEDSRGRDVPLKLSVLKNRDGERGGEPVELRADYATACFAAGAPGTSSESLLDFTEEGAFG